LNLFGHPKIVEGAINYFMIKYNICFVKRGSELLLLNREKSSWMGCWNGVGGKLEQGEQPRQSMIRELYEETGLAVDKLFFKGLITWTVDKERFGGMYVYLAELPDHYRYPSPVKTAEGILDWKELDWILHPENRGVAANLPRTLPLLLMDQNCYLYHFDYELEQLHSSSCMPLNPEIEYNEVLRAAVLHSVEAEVSG
jgi:8-oxo-dGTP diphosphatase